MNLFSAFLKQCLTNPGYPALLEDQRQLNYLQLKNAVGKIAVFLRNQAIPCQRVAIVLERGADAAIAIYGVSFAGACYVPLDIKNPAERLHFISQDADVQYIIGRGTCPKWIPYSAQWLDIGQLLKLPDSSCEGVDIPPDSLAAILYTSGSTGQPKGVALSHRAMLNFINWAAETFSIHAQDRIASLAPFHFDLSVFDLFASLSRGASVHFPPSKLSLFPSRLTRWLSENNITVWYTVPSLLSYITHKGGLQNTPLPNLRCLLFAGEVFPTHTLSKLCALLPGTRLYNLYGPTETNVCCYWPVDKNRLGNNLPIPIGLPACGAELDIASDSGELLVRCVNNLAGYWRNGVLQPLNNGGWYATGDKVSRNRKGEYCYHGRLDRMLKCAGYRIEPAEIEVMLHNIPDIADCAVFGIADTVGGLRPAAAIVLRRGGNLSASLAQLKKKLPAYMLPGKFITLSALPRLTNGKIDYQALKDSISQEDRNSQL